MRRRHSLVMSAWMVLLAMLGCHGGSKGSPPPAQPGFTLQVSPDGLKIPAGGSGHIVVTLSRLNGFSGVVDLTLTGAPAGIFGKGTLATGSGSLTLPIVVASEVPIQTISTIQLCGTCGSLTCSVPLNIQVLTPLPRPAVSPQFVQAAGSSQTGAGIQNQPLAGEVMTVSPAAAGTLTHRAGFHPEGQPAK